MSDSVLDRVRQIASDVLGVPLEQMTSQSTPETLENWDSMRHLNMVLALEGAFGVMFVPEEMERMVSIETIAAIVAEKQT